jgi:NADH:ubiquinone oxidoreductase subunit C
LFTSRLIVGNERFEIYTEFFFINRSDLRRILTGYGFEGRPLRKTCNYTSFFVLTGLPKQSEKLVFLVLRSTRELQKDLELLQQQRVQL